MEYEKAHLRKIGHVQRGVIAITAEMTITPTAQNVFQEQIAFRRQIYPEAGPIKRVRLYILGRVVPGVQTGSIQLWDQANDHALTTLTLTSNTNDEHNSGFVDWTPAPNAVLSIRAKVTGALDSIILTAMSATVAD